VIVFDKELLYAGSLGLVNCSKDFFVRCTPEVWHEVGDVERVWSPRILSFMTDRLYGYVSLGICTTEALPYVHFMHRLGMRPMVCNYSDLSPVAFSAWAQKLNLLVSTGCDIRLINQSCDYEVGTVVLDLRTGYIGVGPRVDVDLDAVRGLAVDVYLGEMLITKHQLRKRPRRLKLTVNTISNCIEVYPTKLGKKVVEDVELRLVRRDIGREMVVGWRMVKITFHPVRRT